MRIFFVKEGMIKGGGVGTLYIRCAEQCKIENIEYMVISSQCSDTLIKDFRKRNIKLKVISETVPFRDTAALMMTSDIGDTKVIVTEYSEYLYFSLRYRSNNKIETILYIVNPYTLYPQNQNKLKKILTIVKNTILRKEIIKNALLDGHIYIMDNDCAERISKYYSLELELCNTAICHLPFESTGLDLKLVKKRNEKRHTHFEILTIARADFPYKGYLLGLIHEMEYIVLEHQNVGLKIISYGSGFELLRNEINNLPFTVRQHIELIGEIQNDELKYYYYDAHLYIGMGTTVLEAANHELPVILAQYSTMQMLSNGFFSEHPNDIATSKEGKSILKLIDSIIKCSDMEYIERCKKSKQALVQNYKSENIIVNFKKKKIINLSRKGFVNWLRMSLDLKIINLTQIRGGV